MNLHVRLTDVQDCRKAISYGIDAPGIVDDHLRRAGHVNRGVNPGMPAADDQEFFDYDPVKAKELLDASTWDKTQAAPDHLRQVVRRRRRSGRPVMQQNLEAIGFKVELKGMELVGSHRGVQQDSTGLRRSLIMQGGDQGVGPFQPADLLQLQADQAGRSSRPIRGTAPSTMRFIGRPQGAGPRQAAGDLPEIVSKLINNAIDKTSSWTTQALSAKSKCLQGVTIPPDTR